MQQFSCYDYYGTTAFIGIRPFRPFLSCYHFQEFSRILLIVQTSQKEGRPEFKVAFLLLPNSNFHIINLVVQCPKSKQSFFHFWPILRRNKKFKFDNKDVLHLGHCTIYMTSKQLVTFLFIVRRPKKTTKKNWNGSSLGLDFSQEKLGSSESIFFPS